MANTNKNTGRKGKKVALGVGLGLAAAAAAGAGYFFFGSKEAVKHRRKAAAWSQKLHKDVMQKAKKLKKLDQNAIRAIIDESTRAYKKVKSIDSKDLEGAARELKANWKHISAELGRVAAKDMKAVKSAAKKTIAKKSAKKVAKKKKA